MGLIRVLLALAVLLSHLPLAHYHILSGGLAVQAFFIISGFYMALVLDGKYRDAGLFYSNRLLRLAPTYLIMLVLGAVVLFALKASVTSSPELMFYAIAPFVTRLKWGWIALLAAASIGLRLAGHWLDVDYLLWQGRLFPTALFMFLAGVLGYRAMPFVEKAPKAVGWAAAAALIGYCLGFTALPLEPLTARWVTYAVVALTVPWVFHAFKDNALDRWIGDLSYPVYLSQLMVIGLVMTFKPPFGYWVAILGTFALSAVVMVVVEHPVDRWRQKRLAARQAGAAEFKQAAP